MSEKHIPTPATVARFFCGADIHASLTLYSVLRSLFFARLVAVINAMTAQLIQAIRGIQPLARCVTMEQIIVELLSDEHIGNVSVTLGLCRFNPLNLCSFNPCLWQQRLPSFGGFCHQSTIGWQRAAYQVHHY